MSSILDDMLAESANMGDSLALLVNLTRWVPLCACVHISKA
jgi:hypothetical protein